MTYANPSILRASFWWVTNQTNSLVPGFYGAKSRFSDQSSQLKSFTFSSNFCRSPKYSQHHPTALFRGLPPLRLNSLTRLLLHPSHLCQLIQVTGTIWEVLQIFTVFGEENVYNRSNCFCQNIFMIANLMVKINSVTQISNYPLESQFQTCIKPLQICAHGPWWKTYTLAPVCYK